MSTNVYALASPTPTLWVYPSAIHAGTVTPPTPSPGGGPIHRRPPPPKPRRRHDDDETALAVLAAI